MIKVSRERYTDREQEEMQIWSRCEEQNADTETEDPDKWTYSPVRNWQ